MLVNHPGLFDREEKVKRLQYIRKTRRNNAKATFKLVKKKRTLLYSNNMPGVPEKFEYGVNAVDFPECRNGRTIT